MGTSGSPGVTAPQEPAAPRQAAREPQPIHSPPASFWLRWVFSKDHKVIAKQYLFLGIAWLMAMGAFAVLIRWQLAYPFQPIPWIGGWIGKGSNGSLAPEQYTMLFTMHGSLMVFFAITPILIGAFGNFLIPLMIGARDMAFPTLNMLSFWFYFAASCVMLVSFFVPQGAASAGWTAYPPLSADTALTLGWGENLWILGIAFVGTSTLLGAINYLATPLNLRCKGMTLGRLPLSVWGLFFSSVLNLIWIPVVAAALVMVLLDRTLGTTFFLAGPNAPAPGGQPLLFQHLFWGFGHPEVYILIFPVWGFLGDLLSIFSRKPAFGYRATVGSMTAVVLLSSVVWGHHMFTSGMSPLLGTAFTFLTITISVPTAIFFLNWLGTLWKGSIEFTVPMLFALGIIFVFAIGGLTGLFNAMQGFDIFVHDTYFVVGHFHFTLAASVLLGGYMAVYYWFPKMFGRQMNRPLGVLHFWLTVVLLNAVFFAMMRVGIGGHMRRIADPTVYSFLKPLQPWNVFMGWATLAMGAAQLLFVVNLVWSLWKGAPAGKNPWRAAGLEWTTSSPPPYHNFDSIPVVARGPHEYGLAAADGRDWLGQSDPTAAGGA